MIFFIADANPVKGQLDVTIHELVADGSILKGTFQVNAAGSGEHARKLLPQDRPLELQAGKNYVIRTNRRDLYFKQRDYNPNFVGPFTLVYGLQIGIANIIPW